MEETIVMHLKLKGVELLRTQINQPLPGFTPGEFLFNLNLESRVDPQNKLVFITTTAEVKSNLSPELLALVSSVCVFTINNFEEVFIKTSEVSFKTDDNIMLTLISISISTLRGIMFDQFRGTYLHQAILPIIDPKQFKLDSN